MNIFDQIKYVLQNRINEIVSPNEIKEKLINQFGTNSDSIILSDYCYNRYNSGIAFDKHIFQYVNRSLYKYLGENYPYTGLIYHKPNGGNEVIVGEWKNGEKTFFETDRLRYDPSNISQLNMISKEQIMKLYEEYNQILQYEIKALKCKPTELRHLTGRIGEFICAIKTDGTLAKETNQHGYDVICNKRRISVKTTAQSTGFISINVNTFEYFDDLFVVQYIQDDFYVIYYGAKEEILKITRRYENTYEIDIRRLKTLASKITNESFLPN
ncbi:protein YnaC [Gracilibacillus halophilus YIM-C55.5]|uniref:Protein YnaC n=1 Tax=Gracilibacillus halophilus YIM-C55.5 TaxID=1308866 RepID=N4WYM0_9BACI|nr:hypothetical protein [Gracilibacillus halophilus]ENH98136.1 protein YnaC [Gracilibacillus halophilus YIM-C55.5]